MGHTRLGDIPKTKAWKTLVASMAGEAGGVGQVPLADDVDAIAAEAIRAATAGLDRAISDQIVQQAYYTLTQLALSSREEDWVDGIARLGISLPEEASILELAAEVQYRLDDFAAQCGGATDTGEIAQAALGEALMEVVGPRSQTLFGSGLQELQDGMREVSSKQGFARLGQAFFSSFLYRFLNFHLSRATAKNAGGTRLPHVGELTRFNQALKHHCDQSSYIVRDFCGQWYNKTEYMEGIDRDNVRGFVAVALKKLQEELARQGAAS